MARSRSTTLESEATAGAAVDRMALRPRVVTAAALYDGHDAGINLVRRLLVTAGAEVIHLGHSRSAHEIARAAIEEDAGAVAVSSYQGGHMEFFPYLRELLDAAGAEDVAIFGGGGGVILPSEKAELEAAGIDRVFRPEDVLATGLDSMAQTIVDRARRSLPAAGAQYDSLRLAAIAQSEPIGRRQLAQAMTAIEAGHKLESDGAGRSDAEALVIGVTGTGGAGKSSLVDELLLHFQRDFPEVEMAVIAVDPTKRRTGGALLGDRLRMNAVYRDHIFCRSFATRGSGSELATAVGRSVELLAQTGHKIIWVETVGIGQGNSGIVDLADLSLYVMTAEFGASTQLEKIDMLDFADVVAVNKADRRWSEDALREVKKVVGRSSASASPASDRDALALGPKRGGNSRPVLGTCANRFNDPGVFELYGAVVDGLRRAAEARARGVPEWLRSAPASFEGSRSPVTIIPPAREGYLREAATAVRDYRQRTATDADRLQELESIERTLAVLRSESVNDDSSTATSRLEELREARREELHDLLSEVKEGEATIQQYSGATLSYHVRDREHKVKLRRESLSGLEIPRVALPRHASRAELLRFLREENLPGYFPFTAGVFPFKREDELPARQFAGEGTPARTNRRFHLLSEGLPARRLSCAFDSVTLYGADPAERPDIYGKIGTSGVSIATLDDMVQLFSGFDLVDSSTSVSMTINGPAPMLLAMFFNAAIEKQADLHKRETGHAPTEDERMRIQAAVLQKIRGTVQADILKEDQAQNTCIFSTEFALKMMADVQEYFIENGVRNYYSVSVSGYHIAEAGANPITQLAFTLANGLTYLEFFRSRGMSPDDFVPNFSFFFSSGLDPEYSVLGRVARRIWAVVMRDVYGVRPRGCKLKYHIQTSGRSLHAREVAFNDIRTTLQALQAIYDNCNSLHTNAYDEAVTTPTEESVRRALAIQLIIEREFGLAKNENPLQGSFILRDLTDLVEEAVLAEFERISDRGGTPGAMESGYMRNRIQEESLHYEELKHSGELPVTGVNYFFGPEADAALGNLAVVRSTEEEKREQIGRLREFQARHAATAPDALRRLRDVALAGGNIFGVLMDTVRHASLGQITDTLFAVGGQYRRRM